MSAMATEAAGGVSTGLNATARPIRSKKISAELQNDHILAPIPIPPRTPNGGTLATRVPLSVMKGCRLSGIVTSTVELRKNVFDSATDTQRRRRCRARSSTRCAHPRSRTQTREVRQRSFRRRGKAYPYCAWTSEMGKVVAQRRSREARRCLGVTFALWGGSGGCRSRCRASALEATAVPPARR